MRASCPRSPCASLQGELCVSRAVALHMARKQKHRAQQPLQEPQGAAQPQVCQLRQLTAGSGGSTHRDLPTSQQVGFLLYFPQSKEKEGVFPAS